MSSGLTRTADRLRGCHNFLCAFAASLPFAVLIIFGTPRTYIAGLPSLPPAESTASAAFVYGWSNPTGRIALGAVNDLTQFSVFAYAYTHFAYQSSISVKRYKARDKVFTYDQQEYGWLLLLFRVTKIKCRECPRQRSSSLLGRRATEFQPPDISLFECLQPPHIYSLLAHPFVRCPAMS